MSVSNHYFEGISIISIECGLCTSHFTVSPTSVTGMVKAPLKYSNRLLNVSLQSKLMQKYSKFSIFTEFRKTAA
jgi:hypothetical protein